MSSPVAGLNKWKVAISTPVLADVDGEQRTIGVMAITVNLGDFSTLRSQDLGNQKVVFLDGRDGVILQHPELRQLGQQEAEKTLSLDEGVLIGLTKPDPPLYVDPVFDKLNAQRAGESWIASTELVKLPGTSTGQVEGDNSSNLIVLVQENYADATTPVVELGKSLRLEGAIALVILIVVVLGMGWVAIKR